MKFSYTIFPACRFEISRIRKIDGKRNSEKIMVFNSKIDPI